MSYNYSSATGVIVPDTSDIKDEVQKEWINALGVNLNLEPQTPQGRLIDVETQARSNVITNIAYQANQINPFYAAGVYLRSIGALSGIQDVSNTYSTCTGVQVTGDEGTIIPLGSRIKNSLGVTFKSIAAITIGVGGTGTGTFQAVDYGPVEAGAGTLTEIVDAFIGWASVTNPTDAVPGTLALTDAEFRTLRSQFLYSQGIGTLGSIYANVKNVTGVTSLIAMENTSDTSQVVQGVTLPPHSVWACVDGGADSDVGLALLKSKSAGAPFTAGDQGTPVSISVTEPYSGLPYTVTYVTPSVVPAICRITVSVDNTVTDPYTAIPLAIQEYVNGKLPKQPGLIVGADVSPFEISGAAMIGVPGVYVQNCEVSDSGPGGYSTSPITIEVWERASLPISAITVIVV